MCSTSILPVSGAAQLMASGAISVLQPGQLREWGVFQVRQPGFRRQEQIPEPALLAMVLSSSTTGDGEVAGAAAARYSS